MYPALVSKGLLEEQVLTPQQQEKGSHSSQSLEETQKQPTRPPRSHTNPCQYYDEEADLHDPWSCSAD